MRPREVTEFSAAQIGQVYLYSLYETGAFVEITQGTNQVPPAPGYSAGPGWNACSGLGRIDGANLLSELD